MVLEILCVEPIYPQYSGVLETCLALRYWFFEVLGSESVKGKEKQVSVCIRLGTIAILNISFGNFYSDMFTSWESKHQLLNYALCSSHLF